MVISTKQVFFQWIAKSNCRIWRYSMLMMFKRLLLTLVLKYICRKLPKILQLLSMENENIFFSCRRNGNIYSIANILAKLEKPERRRKQKKKTWTFTSLVFEFAWNKDFILLLLLLLLSFWNRLKNNLLIPRNISINL